MNGGQVPLAAGVSVRALHHRDGVGLTDPEAASLVHLRRQQERLCSEELHVALAPMYLADECSAAHDERVAPGLAQDLHEALRAGAAGR